MPVDCREHGCGKGLVVGVHAADRRVAAQQERRHTEPRADALGCAREAPAARQAQEELGYANAACTGGEKMTALVHEDEDGQDDDPPEDGRQHVDNRGHETPFLPKARSHKLTCADARLGVDIE